MQKQKRQDKQRTAWENSRNEFKREEWARAFYPLPQPAQFIPPKIISDFWGNKSTNNAEFLPLNIS